MTWRGLRGHKFGVFQGSSVRPGSVRVFARAASVRSEDRVREAKELLRSTLGDSRSTISGNQRGVIEEAKAALEAAAKNIDITRDLPGKWRVLFTTAIDVVPLVAGVSRFAPLQTGSIYQEFSSVEEGKVTNIIQFNFLPLLEKGNRATAKVKASYVVRSSRRIALTFEAAEFCDVMIGPRVEALLAPALLPRSWLNQRLLIAIKEFNLRVPLSNGREARRNLAGEFLLTYLDEDTLVGQQTGGGGYFIFEKENEQAQEPLHLQSSRQNGRSRGFFD